MVVRRTHKLDLPHELAIKVIEGIFFAMSAHITKKINVYTVFSVMMITSVICWTAFMFYDWGNYTYFEVLDSCITNVPLFVLALLSIVCNNTTELKAVRFFVNLVFLTYVFFNGTYFLMIDMVFSKTYSADLISMWAYVTDFVMSFGGMVLSISLLADRG